MPSSIIPWNGLDGRVRYLNINLTLDEWDVTPQGGDIETPTFEGGGNDEGVVGLTVVEFSFAGCMDRNQPLGSLGLWRPANILTPLRIYISKTSNNFFLFPRWRLLQIPTTCKLKNQATRYSIKGKSDGPWSPPLL